MSLASSETLRRTSLSPAGAAPIKHPIVPVQAARKERLASIDLLRGLVMILMALDHTRDFFSGSGFNPRDVAEPVLFLTRWITHFCAPAFVFLAGVSAFLYGDGRHTTGELSRYLFTRGFWLVAIEFTLVRLGWTFSFQFNHLVVQVIAAIGASMIALSALVFLPRWATATAGFIIIIGHNMLDGIKAEQFGAAAPIWGLLHQPGFFNLTADLKVTVLYPLVPWIGVIAVGYALGPVFKLERAARVRRLLVLGVAITSGFVLLRGTNLYGDPVPWEVWPGALATALSFINCEKYPPSLLYLAMTLGPTLLLAAALDGTRGTIAGWIATFGRVPFFYYLTHLYVLHTLAVLFTWVTIGDAMFVLSRKPAGYGLGLPAIYAVWLVVVVSLYPLCRWFDAIKRQGTGWWWTYL